MPMKKSCLVFYDTSMIRELTMATDLLKKVMLSAVLIFAVAGCGSGGLTDPPASSSGSGTTPPVVARISLGTDAATVKSDNSDTATITATALDASNAAVEGATISFTATGGAISAASATTDASGRTSIGFSSGTQDQSNQVVTITASVSGQTAQIPVEVVGSSLTMSSTTVNLPSDGTGTATLTVLAKNAGGVPVRNADIALTVSGAGSVSLSATTGTTDLAGEIKVTVTGALAGTATVKAAWMAGTPAVVSTTASLNYTVSGPAVGVFSITAPTTDPASCSTASTIDVEVTVPDATATPKVTFATTLGKWDGTSAIREVVVTPATKKAKATLSSTLAGLATVQVYDSAAPSTTDSMGVAFYAPASAASQISLQSGVSVLGLSTGGISKTTTLTANVRTATGEPVGGAAVAFSIANPTGGGESISPVVAYTQSTGLATAAFTSGSVSSSAGGVTIDAQVVGMPAVPTAHVSIVIGGTAGSVVIGLGSKITVLNATTYSLPMSVLVADSSGSAVPGAIVSLKLWPVQYSSGVWYNSLAYDPSNPTKVLYKPYVTGTFDNDDVNENTIKDVGEKSDPSGALRPPNSAAGSLPATVTTDANGVANFNLTYLKGSAVWIRDRVRASTLVLGTETTSSITFTLPAERAEAEAGDLPSSVYPFDLTVAATAGATVSYTMPAWVSPYGVTAYSTFSSSSTITPAGVYTFTVPAGVTAGTVYQDYITASDGGSTSSTAWIRIHAK